MWAVNRGGGGVGLCGLGAAGSRSNLGCEDDVSLVEVTPASGSPETLWKELNRQI